MWVKCSDDELLREPYISISGNAYRSHMAAIQMCSRLGLNGRLSGSQVKQVASKGVAAELVATPFTPSDDLRVKWSEVDPDFEISHLWSLDSIGWVWIADYFDHVLTPAERDEKRIAGRKGGQAKGTGSSPSDQLEDQADAWRVPSTGQAIPVPVPGPEGY